MKRIFPILATILMLATACGTDSPIIPDDEGKPDTGNPGTEEPDTEEPGTEEPSEAYYIKVGQSYSDWSGDYLITYSSGTSVLVFDSWEGDDKGASDTDLYSLLTPEGIHSDHGDPYKAVITKVGDAYSINITGVGYIGLEKSANSIAKTSAAPTAGDTKYLWTITYKDGGSVWINISGRRLQWNASAEIFRCYTGSQKELTLYRRSTSTGGSTPSPDPDPDPETPVTPEPDPDTPATPDIGVNSAGYLSCYDVPYASTTLKEGEGYSSKVKEKYGSTYAYIYETTDPNQRVVTHTFSNNGKIHRNYTFLYDYEKHCPIWLSYHMNAGYCGKGGDRTDAWAADPAIPTDEQPDLSKSYCSGGSPYNRGHMLASHARSAIRTANQQAFYYTNMTPQLSANFNTGSGCWNDLETAEMNALPSGRDTLYVVTGCIFENGHKTIKNQVDGLECAVPDSFYKCFMLCSFDASGKMTSAKAAGYLMPHDSPLKSGYSKYAKTIDAIEAVAGYNFFANVPESLQTAAEANIGMNL